MRIDNIKGFFESKIDWKFFNFLKDKALMFEDEGYKIILQIASYDILYDYHTGSKDKYISATDPKTQIEYYKEHGLRYRVQVFDITQKDKIYWQKNHKKTVDFYEYIKSKCATDDISKNTLELHSIINVVPI